MLFRSVPALCHRGRARDNLLAEANAQIAAAAVARFDTVALRRLDRPVRGDGKPRRCSEIVRVYCAPGATGNRIELKNRRAAPTITCKHAICPAHNLRVARRIGVRDRKITTAKVDGANTIAAIVLGSRGIHYKSLPVASERPPEPLLRSLRDGGRSILWVLTGKTGSELAQLSSKLPARP